MTIFIDMDEVIADTYGAHIEIYNAEFDQQLNIQSCLGSEVWQKVPVEHQESIRQHARRRGFFRGLQPITDSQDIVKELSKKYEVYIASAAMEYPNSLEEKSKWLDEYFPFLPWKKRILCGDKRILFGDVLIDDRSYNLESFQGRTILFTSPHNVNSNGYERANNWLEIGDKLL